MIADVIRKTTLAIKRLADIIISGLGLGPVLPDHVGHRIGGQTRFNGVDTFPSATNWTQW